MSGLEAFAIIIIAAAGYALFTLAWAAFCTHGWDWEKDALWLAWMYGMILFVSAIMVWALGVPFPIGG